MEMAMVRAYRSHNDGHFPIRSISGPITHSTSRGSHCAPHREPPDVVLPMWSGFGIFPMWGPYLVHQSPQRELLVHSVTPWVKQYWETTMTIILLLIFDKMIEYIAQNKISMWWFGVVIRNILCAVVLPSTQVLSNFAFYRSSFRFRHDKKGIPVINYILNCHRW